MPAITPMSDEELAVYKTFAKANSSRQVSFSRDRLAALIARVEAAEAPLRQTRVTAKTLAEEYFLLVKEDPANAAWKIRDLIIQDRAARANKLSSSRAEVDKYGELFDGNHSVELHANILRTGALSRAHALHIAGATDYDSLRAEVETLRAALRQLGINADSDLAEG